MDDIKPYQSKKRVFSAYSKTLTTFDFTLLTQKLWTCDHES